MRWVFLSGVFFSLSSASFESIGVHLRQLYSYRVGNRYTFDLANGDFKLSRNYEPYDVKLDCNNGRRIGYIDAKFNPVLDVRPEYMSSKICVYFISVLATVLWGQITG